MRWVMSFLVLVTAFLCGCSLLNIRKGTDLKAPVALRVENMASPVGIDVQKPRLSWKLVAGRGRFNLKQHSYQIKVADSLEKLEIGTIWNSGRVVSEAQFNIRYDGEELRSSQRYYWKVRVWSSAQAEPTDWSEPVCWVTGIMQPHEWRAQWIGPNKITRPDYDLKGARWIWHGFDQTLEDCAAGNTFYYASFKAPNDVSTRNIIMALTADDTYEVYINGELAAKCWGHLNDWKWMRFIAVGRYLKPGKNTIAVRVENKKRGPTGMLMVIRDERYVLLRSDSTWRAARNRGKDWFKPETAARAEYATVKIAGEADCAPWGKIERRFENTTPAFEKSFAVVDKPFERAVLHISGLGFYEASLNGEKIGCKVLDPNPTRYDRRVLYSSYDISDSLRTGLNDIAVTLGHGWYDLRSVSVWNFDNAPWRDFPRMIAQLEIHYADGTTQRVCSDSTWRQINTPLGYDCIREGVVVGKNHPDAPDLTRQVVMAEVVNAPEGRLSASMLPPTVVSQRFKPASVRKLDDKRWLVDFGQNMAGWVDIKVEGQSEGDVITLLYGERINEDGTLNNKSISAHFRYPASTALVKDGYFQKDHIICDGRDGWVEYPHFVYYGFQYVEIEGLSKRPDTDNIAASVVQTDFKQCGSFHCSNELLNKLQRAAVWAYIGNFSNGYPTDCPHREKNGWTGDASLAAEMGMYNFDNTAAYEKWIQDIMDEQRPDGNFAAIIPTSGWGYKWGNGPAWDSALLTIPWALYIYKGDLSILEHAYDSMRKYVDYMTSKSSGHLVTHGLGDWVPAKSKVPAEITSSAYFYMDALIVSRSAKLLGKENDARNYANLAERIKRAFNARHYKGDGIYSIGTQTALSCALHQGIAADDMIDPTRRALIKLVEERDKCVMDFGILGSKYIFRSLSDAGRSDIAYRMLCSTNMPSFGRWITEENATTLWEDWEKGQSRNHIMFGDFSAWLYQYLGGIRLSDDVSAVASRIDSTKIAFKEFIIAPEPVEDLTHVRAHHDSPYGVIASEWKIEDGEFTLKVSIPVNTTATIYLPVTPGTDGIESSVPEVQSDRARAAFAVGSGDYVFKTPI
jgi:alpha-L-rhamnosidase